MIRLYLKYADIEGIKKAPEIFIQEVTKALEIIGKRLKTSMQGRMRQDSKASKNSLQIEVRGRGLDKSLTVYSDLLQAFVDAEGLRPGKAFPSIQPGSRLYRWAQRKVAGKPSKTVRTTSFAKRAKGRPKKATRAFRVKDYPKLKTPVTKTTRQKRADANVRRFAFLVARKIYRKGIDPTHWNTEALKANEARINRELTNGVLRAVNRINRG